MMLVLTVLYSFKTRVDQLEQDRQAQKHGMQYVNVPLMWKSRELEQEVDRYKYELIVSRSIISLCANSLTDISTIEQLE